MPAHTPKPPPQAIQRAAFRENLLLIALLLCQLRVRMQTRRLPQTRRLSSLTAMSGVGSIGTARSSAVSMAGWLAGWVGDLHQTGCKGRKIGSKDGAESRTTNDTERVQCRSLRCVPTKTFLALHRPHIFIHANQFKPCRLPDPPPLRGQTERSCLHHSHPASALALGLAAAACRGGVRRDLWDVSIECN